MLVCSCLGGSATWRLVRVAALRLPLLLAALSSIHIDHIYLPLVEVVLSAYQTKSQHGKHAAVKPLQERWAAPMNHHNTILRTLFARSVVRTRCMHVSGLWANYQQTVERHADYLESLLLLAGRMSCAGVMERLRGASLPTCVRSQAGSGSGSRWQLAAPP